MKQMKGSDRRIVRTSTQLKQALYALILEKPYERITVQDILDRANIGRSTFYAHFQDKDDLLLDNMPDNILTFDQDSDTLIPSLVPIFTHTQENYRLFRALISSKGITLVHRESEHKTMQSWLSHIEKMQAKGTKIPLPPAIIAQYLTGAFTSLMRWWLDEGMPYTPTEMDAMFQQLARKGLAEMTTTFSDRDISEETSCL